MLTVKGANLSTHLDALKSHELGKSYLGSRLMTEFLISYKEIEISNKHRASGSIPGEDDTQGANS